MAAAKKEEKKSIKTALKSGHTTNLNQSILRLSIFMGFMGFTDRKNVLNSWSDSKPFCYYWLTKSLN
jgi:hypothetical protein